MGRTVPTYRMHLEAILNEWMDYRRALREKDREAFDRLVAKARRHASAASYAAHMDPTVLAILSILLEMEKEIQTPRDIHRDTQTPAAKTIAVADDVYETLLREKGEDESFSDVIRRWHGSQGSLGDCHGLPADILEEEFREREGAIDGFERPASEERKGRKGGK